MGNLVTRGCDEIDFAEFPGFRLDANVCRRPSCRVTASLWVFKRQITPRFKIVFPIIFDWRFPANLTGVSQPNATL